MNNEKKLYLKNVVNEESYLSIINEINSYYDECKKFHLLIETNKVSRVDIIYLYKIGVYLKDLKNKDPQYLTETTINVYDDYNYNILFTLFTFISSPVTKVNVIYYDGGYNNPEILTKRKIKKIKMYFPS